MAAPTAAPTVPPTVPPTAAPTAAAIQFYRSERGRDYAVHKGYGYGLDTVTQRGAKRLWRCHVKGCHGRMHTMGHSVVFTAEHSHQPVKGLKEKMSLWKQIQTNDMSNKGRAANLQRPTSLSTAKVRADLLYNSVTQSSMDQWPALIHVLQHLMDRVAQHVTGGSVSCVQMIPVDSNSCTEQLLTLQDMVSNTVSQAQVYDEQKYAVRPCSVVVNKLDESELLHLSLDQGLGPISLLDIKQEVVDADEEDTGESTPEPIHPTVVAPIMKQERNIGEHEPHPVSRPSILDHNNDVDEEEDEEDVDDDPAFDDSDGNIGDEMGMENEWADREASYAAETDVSNGGSPEDKSDDEWQPRARARKSKNPRKRRSSSQHYMVSNTSDDEGSHPKRGKKFTPRRNRFLVAEKYENYDLKATFDDTTQKKCFLCPANRSAEVNSLEDFIEHLTDANHLAYKKTVLRVLTCPICLNEVRNRTSVRDGAEKIQILRLAGKVLQHMETAHGYNIEGTFLCAYQCDKCVFTSFGVGSFLEHMHQAHRNDPTTTLVVPASPQSQQDPVEKQETYDIRAQFAEGLNCVCPFCPVNSAYRPRTLADLVSHVKERNHLMDVDGKSRQIRCPECGQEKYGNITDGLPEETQILRLIGKAVQHMVSEHNYILPEGFLPRYQCGDCAFPTYDCTSFVEHRASVHGEKQAHKEMVLNSKDRIADDQLKKYLPCDLEAPYDESVDTSCPFCPRELIYKSSSLSNFLNHVQHAEHLVHGVGPLYSMSCPLCNNMEKCRIYEMSDMQVLRVVGRLLQHLATHHQMPVSPQFVPQYQCEECRYTSFSYTDFIDHARRTHLKETHGSSDEEESAEKAEEEGLGGFSKFPERHVRMNTPFSQQVDTSCPFCASDNAYKAKTMADFIDHVYAAGHLIASRDCRYIQCTQCDEKLKSRVFVNFGKKSTQTLRVIGKAAHHMYEMHGTRFEEGFLPVYECDKCVYNTYSGEQLTDHARSFHRKVGGKTRTNRYRWPTAVVHKTKTVYDREGDHLMSKAKSDMCNLHLINDIYENNQKTLLSFEEPLKQSHGTNCPLCTEPTSFVNLHDFAKHCANTHVMSDMSVVTIPCPDCQTTIACKKYKNDEPITLGLSIVGKWADHRFKKHKWTVPLFMPLYRCPCCQDFTTYSPRTCHGHIYTPGKCRTNPGDRRKILQPCPCCGKMISQRSYSSHVQVCSKPDNERKRTECPVCGKLFLDELSYHRSNLKHHIAIVHGDYFPHLCSICSTQFKRRNDLNRHMFMAHDINISKNEPLYCDKCDYKTLLASHLKRHYTKHNQDGQVTCHFCGKQYKSEQHLKRHIEDVHDKGAQQYRCSQCSYVTKSKRYLQKHVRWHYSTKVGAGHWCTICNYNARFPSVLKFHMKNVHKINMEDPGPEKQASFKSVVMKRRYKNMKLPGEGEKLLSVFRTDTSSAASAGGGGAQMEGTGDEEDMSVPEDLPSPPTPAPVDPVIVNAPAFRASCAQPQATFSQGQASTGSAPATTTSALPLPVLSDLPPTSHHQQPHHHHPQHHHHHPHPPETEGLTNMVPAHRPLLGHMPGAMPGSSVLGSSQQAGEYMYNPQLFGGFLPPQGLPPQYY